MTKISITTIEDQQDQGEHQRRVVGALGERQQVSQPVGRRHEFADAGAGEGKADGDLQIAQHPGRDRRQVDMAHQRQAIAAQGDDALDQLAVDLADAGVHGEEDQHRHQDEAERDLRGDADAEPDHEQRRQDHARDGVEHAHHRLQQLGNEGDRARRQRPAGRRPRCRVPGHPAPPRRSPRGAARCGRRRTGRRARPRPGLGWAQTTD